MEFQNIGHISSQEEEKDSSSLDFSVSTHKIESEIELRYKADDQEIVSENKKKFYFNFEKKKKFMPDLKTYKVKVFKYLFYCVSFCFRPHFYLFVEFI